MSLVVASVLELEPETEFAMEVNFFRASIALYGNYYTIKCFFCEEKK